MPGHVVSLEEGGRINTQRDELRKRLRRQQTWISEFGLVDRVCDVLELISIMLMLLMTRIDRRREQLQQEHFFVILIIMI